MALRLLFTVLLCFVSIAGWAQGDTIAHNKFNFPTIYKMNGKNIWSLRKLKKIMRNDAEATALIKKGNRIGIAGVVCMEAGVFIIASEFFNSPYRNGVVRPAVIAVGVAFVGASVPLSLSSRRKMREGVKTFNRHVKEGLSSP